MNLKEITEQFKQFIPSYTKKPLTDPTTDYEPKLETQKEADETGSSIVDDIAMGGMVDYTIDFDQVIKTMEDLILTYRKMAHNGDVDNAVEIISSEAIIQDAKDKVKANLDKIEISDSIKKKIHSEFEDILRMLNFDIDGYDTFRQFYIDGRLYVQKVVDKSGSIVELKVLNPLKLFPAKSKQTGGTFFIYRPQKNSRFDYKIHKDHITMITSGIRHHITGMALSNLHRSIIPLNQLETLEQSAIIYRLVRAPERRVFRIDVGRLPKSKAESYVKRLMDKFRNKLTYNVSTGAVTQKKDQITMAEDFWFPKDSEGRGTDVETLDGGTQLGEIQDITYHQDKFFRSLKIPSNRLRTKDDNPTINFGDSGELTREELKFYKYIVRVRNKFSNLFIQLLQTQCILKKICNLTEWNKTFKNQILFDWAVDNYYEEKKEAEILEGRLELLGTITEYIGSFYSKQYVQKQVLKMSDDDIDEMNEQIASEVPEEEPEEDDTSSDNDTVNGKDETEPKKDEEPEDETKPKEE